MKTIWTCIAILLTIGLYGQNAEFTYAYRANGEIIATDAPRHENTIYRVELLKTPHFNGQDPALKTLQEFGTLRTEYLIEKEMTCILLGDFHSLNEAQQCLSQVREFGLNEAKIIRYQKGFRQGAVRDVEI